MNEKTINIDLINYLALELLEKFGFYLPTEQEISSMEVLVTKSIYAFINSFSGVNANKKFTFIAPIS